MKTNALQLLIVGTLVVLTQAVPRADAVQSPDSDGEARRFRASAKALEYLVEEAELRTGVTVLTFEGDPANGYTPEYASSVCPVRGRSRLFALRGAGRDDVEAEVIRLHAVADFDGSGFVSDPEGERFGSLVLFGRQVEFLLDTAREPASRLGRDVRLTEGELRSRLDEYRALVKRAEASGVALVRPQVE